MIYKPLLYAWKHAKLAYEEPESLINEILSDSDFIFRRTEDDFCYIAAYRNHIVISFEGSTNNIGDWISNLDPYPLDDDLYMRKHIGGGIIHDGFYDSWAKFKQWVTIIVSEYVQKSDIKEIIVTGHSRGGALAELCARHLAKNMKLSCSCITFGCPAPGNKSYRDEFRSLPINGTRVVNGWDIVTFVPPHALGFRHGCANKIWNKKIWFKRIMPYSRIRDHLTKNYDKFITERFG